MRVPAILLVAALAAFALVPTVEAHWDSSSTDPCPPANDIRWWGDHVHRSCCTPSVLCVLADVSAVALP